MYLNRTLWSRIRWSDALVCSAISCNANIVWSRWKGERRESWPPPPTPLLTSPATWTSYLLYPIHGSITVGYRTSVKFTFHNSPLLIQAVETICTLKMNLFINTVEYLEMCCEEEKNERKECGHTKKKLNEGWSRVIISKQSRTDVP